MKSLVKSLFPALALCAAGAVNAGPIINVSYLANAQADFLATLNGTTVTEDFDGLGGARVIGSNQQSSWENKSSSFDTNVGTFTLSQAGQASNGNVFNNQLMIESRRTGEFGREALASSSTDLWLDSNDAKKVVWNFSSASLAGGFFNAIGFYMADAADVSAILTMTFDDGTSSAEFKIFPKLPNATVAYVSILSDKNIVDASFTFLNNTLNDGWGIDSVTIGKVPEPGTLLLLTLGLIGLGFARRRTLSH